MSFQHFFPNYQNVLKLNIIFQGFVECAETFQKAILFRRTEKFEIWTIGFATAAMQLWTNVLL